MQQVIHKAQATREDTRQLIRCYITLYRASLDKVRHAELYRGRALELFATRPEVR